MHLNKLTINHNHGTLVLRDVEIDDQNVAHGIVEDGGVTNRLFHVSSYTPFPKGKPKSWPLYGFKLYERHVGRTVDGQWVESPTPGNFYVDCTWCG